MAEKCLNEISVDLEKYIYLCCRVALCHATEKWIAGYIRFIVHDCDLCIFSYNLCVMMQKDELSGKILWMYHLTRDRMAIEQQNNIVKIANIYGN